MWNVFREIPQHSQALVTFPSRAATANRLYRCWTCCSGVPIILGIGDPLSGMQLLSTVGIFCSRFGEGSKAGTLVRFRRRDTTKRVIVVVNELSVEEDRSDLPAFRS